MGTLIPEDFDLSRVDRSLVDVTEILRSETDAEWLVLPRIPTRSRGAEHTIDLVLIHPRCGVLVLAVLSGPLTWHGTEWRAGDRLLAGDPFDLSRRNAEALRRRLLHALGEEAIAGVRFASAVVAPDVETRRSVVPDDDTRAAALLTAAELRSVPDSLDRLSTDPVGGSVPEPERIVKVLLPTVTITGSLGIDLRGIGRQLDDVTQDMISAARGGEVNPGVKVLVTGPAGVGKTKLADSWARRASQAGERVFLTCFNVPIGMQLAAEFADDPNVTAGPFKELAKDWLGLQEPEVGEDERETNRRRRDFYDVDLPNALIERRNEMPKFDVLIVDEFQDVNERWVRALESLLDPAGSMKQFRLEDERQRIYQRNRVAHDGFHVHVLTNNCRNTRHIAEVALRIDNETRTYSGNPDGPPIRFVPVNELDGLAGRVGAEIEYLVREQSVGVGDIAVICTRNNARDTIREKLGADVFEHLASGGADQILIGEWEDRDEDVIVCENAHRLKGTEWHAVILVNLVDLADLAPEERAELEKVLYVGVTRATTWLSVIGTAETGDYLGLRPVDPD